MNSPFDVLSLLGSSTARQNDPITKISDLASQAGRRNRPAPMRNFKGFGDGAMFRVEITFDGALLRGYAAGVEGTNVTLLLMVNFEKPVEIEEPWAQNFDQTKEHIVILHSGTKYLETLQAALNGKAADTTNKADGVSVLGDMRTFMRYAGEVNQDIVHYLAASDKTLAAAHIIDDNKGARFWEALGFGTIELRDGHVFRTLGD